MVRNLVDGVWAPAGRYVVRLDGWGAGGASLMEGVYYFQIRTADGARTGRFVVIR